MCNSISTCLSLSLSLSVVKGCNRGKLYTCRICDTEREREWEVKLSPKGGNGEREGEREGGKAPGRSDKETTRREGERRDTCRVRGREREREREREKQLMYL